MQNTDLEKSAEKDKNEPIPKEVLNPLKTAKLYTFHIYQPSADLAPFIDYFWVMRWDLTNQPPFTAEVIPSPYTNLTFMPEGARITGVTTGKYEYELRGRGAIVGVKFKPGGLHAFWPKSLHEITDKVVPASQLFPQIDSTYNGSILHLPDKSAVKKIDMLLLTAKPTVDKNLELIKNIMSYIETPEHISLDDVIKHAQLSERRLQEIFREHVGVGIKWIVLRARLIQAAQLAVDLRRPNWTTIAHDLGYGDQSHFINDFKRIIGKTPKQYAASVQDVSTEIKPTN